MTGRACLHVTRRTGAAAKNADHEPPGRDSIDVISAEPYTAAL